MSFRLRRMVLVNAGTNKQAPSGRITEIDPRGGAAVIGANGVGKTTALKVVPLFFGHLPSQIVTAGQGLEPLVRHILRSHRAAIVFEYQRGSDEAEDIRIAVMRLRSDGADAPEYRIYKTGFQKEHFAAAGGFLDDEETDDLMRASGIQGTRKLTPADYRCIILRTRSNSKEAERLRRYSVEHSFGPKAMPNLDRLVAAMVKPRINFEDIVQVAVGMVQEEQGLGAEGGKRSMKQGKASIQQWLVNRDACEDAAKLGPKVQNLQGHIGEHRMAEGRFRELRFDVESVAKARAQEHVTLGEQLNAAAVARDASKQADCEQREGFEQASSRADTLAREARATHQSAVDQQERLVTERAEHWEKEVELLPTLRQRLRNLQAQAEAANRANADATTHYTNLWTKVESDAQSEALRLEGGKQAYNQRCETAVEAAAAAEREALVELGELERARRDELSDQLAPLQAAAGKHKAAVDTPRPDPELESALEAAMEKRREHGDAVLKSTTRLNEARDAVRVAEKAHQSAGDLRMGADSQLEQGNAALAVAANRLRPADGSLLAALKADSSGAWKQSIARVLNPELLGRIDLDAKQIDGAGDALYGWSLRTEAIETPDWADDSLLQAAVDECETRLVRVRLNLKACQEAELSTSDAFLKAQSALAIVEAEHGVLTGKSQGFEDAVALARQQVSNSRQTAKTAAEEAFNNARRAIEEIARQQRGVAQDFQEQRRTATSASETQKKFARGERDRAIAAIDEAIKEIQEQALRQVRELKAQLLAKLTEAGIDPQHLIELGNVIEHLSADIETRQSKVSLVEQWRAWQRAGGASRVAQLKAAAVAETNRATAAAKTLTQFNLDAANRLKAHQQAITNLETRRGVVEGEVAALGSLVLDFGDYLPTPHAERNLERTANDLRMAVIAERSRIDELAAKIRSAFNTIRLALTSRDSAVKELVDASLARVADHGEVSRANELCLCYRLIGPQVITNVNTSLKAVLGNIGQFRKSIVTFEKEVKTFNEKLQIGLNEVRRFERIGELSLHIVTNFESLDFYRKLSKMDDVIREHASQRGGDARVDLPPVETAQALRDFMGVIGADGTLEVNLASHITLAGSVTENGVRRHFRRAAELENISSTGLTAVILITLMSGLLNAVRAGAEVYVPWVSDEVGKYDPANFAALMQMLSDNRIDVITASPELPLTQLKLYAQRYQFLDHGEVRYYQPRKRPGQPAVAEPEIA